VCSSDLTTSGNRATYSAGCEVNVAVAGSQAAEIRAIAYGCALTVLPRLDPGPGVLDLEVQAEVSDLTETSADVPGRTISKVSTLVHLGLGQSIVLSGLDAESASKGKSGLPGLSRVPILGMLFGVHRSREEQVNGLIAITPAVIDDPGRDGRRRLDEALARFERFRG
jgi:pilus assembly protein CpaC